MKNKRKQKPQYSKTPILESDKLERRPFHKQTRMFSAHVTTYQNLIEEINA